MRMDSTSTHAVGGAWPSVRHSFAWAQTIHPPFVNQRETWLGSRACGRRKLLMDVCIPAYQPGQVRWEQCFLLAKPSGTANAFDASMEHDEDLPSADACQPSPSCDTAPLSLA